MDCWIFCNVIFSSRMRFFLWKRICSNAWKPIIWLYSESTIISFGGKKLTVENSYSQCCSRCFNSWNHLQSRTISWVLYFYAHFSFWRNIWLFAECNDYPRLHIMWRKWWKFCSHWIFIGKIYLERNMIFSSLAHCVNYWFSYHCYNGIITI